MADNVEGKMSISPEMLEDMPIPVLGKGYPTYAITDCLVRFPTLVLSLFLFIPLVLTVLSLGSNAPVDTSPGSFSIADHISARSLRAGEDAAQYWETKMDEKLAAARNSRPDAERSIIFTRIFVAYEVSAASSLDYIKRHGLSNLSLTERNERLGLLSEGNLRYIHEVENHIQRKIALYEKLCWSARFRGGPNDGAFAFRRWPRCTPPNSAMTWFYPGELYNESIPKHWALDNSGVLQMPLERVRDLFFTSGQYRWFVDQAASANNHQVSLLRSQFAIGAPFETSLGIATTLSTDEKIARADELLNAIAAYLLHGLPPHDYIRVSFGGPRVEQAIAQSRVAGDSARVFLCLLVLFPVLWYYFHSFVLSFLATLQLALVYPTGFFLYTVGSSGTVKLSLLTALSYLVTLVMATNGMMVFFDTFRQSGFMPTTGRRNLLTVAQRMAYSYRKAGAGISAASFIVIICFIVNTTSKVPAVRDFAGMAAIFVAVNWVQLLTFFPAAMLFHHFHISRKRRNLQKQKEVLLERGLRVRDATFMNFNTDIEKINNKHYSATFADLQAHATRSEEARKNYLEEMRNLRRSGGAAPIQFQQQQQQQHPQQRYQMSNDDDLHDRSNFHAEDDDRDETCCDKMQGTLRDMFGDALFDPMSFKQQRSWKRDEAAKLDEEERRIARESNLAHAIDQRCERKQWFRGAGQQQQQPFEGDWHAGMGQTIPSGGDGAGAAAAAADGGGGGGGLGDVGCDTDQKRKPGAAAAASSVSNSPTAPTTATGGARRAANQDPDAALFPESQMLDINDENAFLNLFADAPGAVFDDGGASKQEKSSDDMTVRERIVWRNAKNPDPMRGTVLDIVEVSDINADEMLSYDDSVLRDHLIHLGHTDFAQFSHEQTSEVARLLGIKPVDAAHIGPERLHTMVGVALPLLYGKGRTLMAVNLEQLRTARKDKKNTGTRRGSNAPAAAAAAAAIDETHNNNNNNNSNNSNVAGESNDQLQRRRRHDGQEDGAGNQPPSNQLIEEDLSDDDQEKPDDNDNSTNNNNNNNNNTSVRDENNAAAEGADDNKASEAARNDNDNRNEQLQQGHQQQQQQQQQKRKTPPAAPPVPARRPSSHHHHSVAGSSGDGAVLTLVNRVGTWWRDRTNVTRDGCCGIFGKRVNETSEERQARILQRTIKHEGYTWAERFFYNEFTDAIHSARWIIIFTYVALLGFSIAYATGIPFSHKAPAFLGFNPTERYNTIKAGFASQNENCDYCSAYFAPTAAMPIPDQASIDVCVSEVQLPRYFLDVDLCGKCGTENKCLDCAGSVAGVHALDTCRQCVNTTYVMKDMCGACLLSESMACGYCPARLGSASNVAGADCAVVCDSSTCRNGVCNPFTGKCECTQGPVEYWTGEKCDQCLSGWWGTRCESHCNTRATPGVCNCFLGKCSGCPAGLAGESCEFRRPDVCDLAGGTYRELPNGRGWACQCRDGYAGKACKASSNCNGRGYFLGTQGHVGPAALNRTCACFGQWRGPACQSCRCYNGGVCSETGSCICASGWGGVDCQECASTCLSRGGCPTPYSPLNYDYAVCRALFCTDAELAASTAVSGPCRDQCEMLRGNQNPFCTFDSVACVGPNAAACELNQDGQGCHLKPDWETHHDCNCRGMWYGDSCKLCNKTNARNGRGITCREGDGVLLGCDKQPKRNGRYIYLDECNTCGGSSTSGKQCKGCDGIAGSTKTVDRCGVCGGFDDCAAATGSTSQELVRPQSIVAFTWGILPYEDASALASSAAASLSANGAPILRTHNDFDFEAAGVQEELEWSCEAMKKETAFVKADQTRCFVTDWKQWVLAQGPQAKWPVRSAGVNAGAQSAFQFAVSFGRLTEIAFTSFDNNTKGFAVKWIRMLVRPVGLHDDDSRDHLEEQWRQWKYLQGRLNADYSKNLGPAMMGSTAFVALFSLRAAMLGTTFSIVLGCCIFAVLILAITCSALLSICCFLVMVGNILFVLAMFRATGWQMGPIEQVSIALLIGVVSERIVHMCISYNEYLHRIHSHWFAQEATRLQAVRNTMQRVGVSLAVSSVTLIIGSTIALSAELFVIQRIAIIVLIIVATQLLYALCILPALMLVMGPVTSKVTSGIRAFYFLAGIVFFLLVFVPPAASGGIALV